MSMRELSKFISLILRHKPEVIGIRLDEHGWADVEELLKGINRTRHIDTETAVKVGSRHGRPVVYWVAAGKMKADGHVFYRSVNGVWLTKEVPVRYLELLR